LTQVQNGLVTLINMAAKVENLSVAELGRMPLEQSPEEKPKSDKAAAEKVTAPPMAEGPQINTESNPEVVSGQDDVDELLSSLGF
ncbi:chemotaxis protein CheZ, partial ['Osedax' symbiont bacterium Rs2_46_30_T18]